MISCKLERIKLYRKTQTIRLQIVVVELIIIEEKSDSEKVVPLWIVLHTYNN